MPGKQKNPQKIAEGLAKGLTQMQAVQEAGYTSSIAAKKAYAIVKRPLVQSSLTEAPERQDMTLERILQPVVQMLDATLVVRTIDGLRKTQFPDHRIRLEAHVQLVSLYGGTSRSREMPPRPPKSLVMIIQKDGGPFRSMPWRRRTGPGYSLLVSRREGRCLFVLQEKGTDGSPILCRRHEENCKPGPRHHCRPIDWDSVLSDHKRP